MYSQVKQNVIRSDAFKSAGSKLNGVSVILCTLSMLSNVMIKLVFLKKVPINCLVVDEASQIEIGNYITTFTEFGATLRKVCFIGDDKQCEYTSCPCHNSTDIVQKKSAPIWPRGH